MSLFTTEFVLACGIGLLVMCAVYIGLRRAFGRGDSTVRRASAVFSAVAGIVVTVFLNNNPDVLQAQGLKIVLALIAVVLALIAVARRNVA